MNMTVADLQGELARTRSLTPPMSLMAEFYTSEDWLAQERQRIFRKEWICVGRGSEFSAVGAYRTFDIDGTRVIVVKRRDGQLGAMVAVCLHRMAEVAQGSGCAKGFVCPYHGWTYNLEGRLIAAPRMTLDFERSGRALAQIGIQEWNGFVYVNLDATAAPLTNGLQSLDTLLAPYHMERMQVLTRQRHKWRTNWKVLVENFLEIYHINVTHPETLAPFAPPEGARVLPTSGAFQFYEHRMPDSYKPVPLDPHIGIPNADLDEEQKQVAYIGCIFPSHLFSVTWDSAFWLSLQPHGVHEVEIDVGLAGPFDIPCGTAADADHPNLYWMRLIDAINAEDRTRVESVQRGAQSGFGKPSLLHADEATITGFVSYLLDKMVNS
jgi:phenylpropionate dioxygenase-like ring-hydroxylating dioxygenase large terminal subunit